MKTTVTMEFNEDDKYRLKTIWNAEAWRGIVFELDEWLRGKIKHEDHKEWEPVRSMLNEMIRDEGLTLLEE